MGIAGGQPARAGACSGGPEVARRRRGDSPTAERFPATEKTLGERVM
ncbi:hypothetical protein TIFTF001_010672 [Ficus carica]|uniref:Uncharacterized protein n=1 Tax=Ficus carica TaxID=3494 RepID=A0AA87ZY37_FICCA|nr:hypothetical protein TIFTF001_010672 [Ficus carica]